MSPRVSGCQSSLTVAALALFASAIGIALWAYGSTATVGTKPVYEWLLQEDGPAETLTAICLLVGSLFSLVAVSSMSGSERRSQAFLLLLGIGLLLMALEEISWGQRIFGIQSGEFFQRYNGQAETNFHNTMQLYLKNEGIKIFRTREIAAVLLLLYGVALPVLNRNAWVRTRLRQWGVIVPAPILMIGFFFGAVLAWFDRPTGQEEELGELLFAMALMLLVPLWMCRRARESQQRGQGRQHLDPGAPLVRGG